MERTNNFTNGKIVLPLIKFTIPVLFAIFLQTMYGAADMLIVGQFSNAAEVSAVSTGSWIMQIITSAVIGLAMGTTILLGHKLGQSKEKEAGAVIGASIYLFAIIGIIITVIVVALSPVIATIMHAPTGAYSSTVWYIRICSAGTIFIIAYNVLGSIFRGIGNSTLPLIAVIIACIINILGDLLLVGVFGLGAAGAAIATVFAQAISVIVSIIITKKLSLPFKLSKKDIKFEKDSIRNVIKLGFPICLQDILVCISFIVITAIANSLGVIPSAGVGVAEKICGFVLIIPSSFMQSMSAFVAQNIGANQPERAKKALFYAILISLSLGIFLAYFTFFHGDILASMFAKDHNIVLAAADYLKAYAIDCLLVSFLFCLMGYFNGCGKTNFVMIQGIIGAFLVRIPISYIMSKAVPVSLFKIGLATPASTVIQIILCFIYFISIQKSIKYKNKLTQAKNE